MLSTHRKGFNAEESLLNCERDITTLELTLSKKLYLHKTFPVISRVEEESAEHRHMNTVGQHSQVSLRELEGRDVLLNKLPHTLEKQEEDRRLTLGNINKIEIKK